MRARARVGCVTREEAVALAKEEHKKNGHFHRDNIKMVLMDKIQSPRLDELIVRVIKECAKCKGFGGMNLHALLKPITHRHPLELLMGDYLSLSAGKGGYHVIGLYLDTCSQHIWGFMYKTNGTAKTTMKALANIFHQFLQPEMLMMDGGTHFNNNEVQELGDQAHSDSGVRAMGERTGQRHK